MTRIFQLNLKKRKKKKKTHGARVNNVTLNLKIIDLLGLINIYLKLTLISIVIFLFYNWFTGLDPQRHGMAYVKLIIDLKIVKFQKL